MTITGPKARRVGGLGVLLFGAACNGLLGIDEAGVDEGAGPPGAQGGAGQGGAGAAQGGQGSAGAISGNQGNAGAAGVGGQGGAAGGGAGEPALKLALGGSHSCVILGRGEAQCWGANVFGQLGDGTVAPRLTPVPVELSPGVPLTGALAAAAGGYQMEVEGTYDGTAHSCALRGGGEIHCWGSNSNGQLGNGALTPTSNHRPAPVLLSPGVPLTGALALGLGVGEAHRCALVSRGEVRCWGGNSAGQLGDGTTTQRLNPVLVLLPSGVSLTGAQMVALGSRHSCALVSGGEARCWGSNALGRLGDGTTADRLNPVPVLLSPGLPLTGIKALALGNSHTCAVVGQGEVRCWGNNSSGQLGDGTTASQSSPTPVLLGPGVRLKEVQALALGYEHSCALVGGGDVVCWGGNAYGQLGDGTTTSRPGPVPVELSPGVPLTGALAVATGYDHSCAHVTGGKVFCWGANYGGQLGDGTITGRPTPVRVIFTTP